MKLFISLIVIITIALPEIYYSPTKTGKTILEKSIQKYDPEGQWPNLSIKARFQEPRLRNPERYSIISMNPGDGYFRMDRNRDEKIATYIIETDGTRKVLIDGEAEFPEAWQDKYRLDPNLITIYQRSYNIIYGLPMTLNDQLIEEITDVTKTTFDQKPAYRIEVALREPLFSKHWWVFIDRKDYSFLGLEMFEREGNKITGERLIFDDRVVLEKTSVPRIKHWYDLESGEFLGSDILVKLLE